MKKTLQDLTLVAPEMLSGLHAGSEMRARILEARRPSVSHALVWRVAPVCAAAVIAIVGASALLRSPATQPSDDSPIGIHAAGDGQTIADPRADVPEGSLEVKDGGNVSAFRQLFEGKKGNFPLVGYDGRAYRMLSGSVGNGTLGDELGAVTYVDDASQVDSNEWYGLISNKADDGSAVYSISGLSSQTAVAAMVGGKMRLFQRFTYGDYGTSGDSLESVLDVRGQVASLDLSGVGPIADSGTANALIDTLLDNAVFQSNDVSGAKQGLTINLSSGLTLQIFVSQDTFSACGSWNCPEFIEEYQAAIGQ